jgi:tRNA threonylcarbamoyladenosine biosynthesis protein TsaB
VKQYVRKDEVICVKILGVDSSGLVASTAVLQDDIVVAEFTVNNKQTHSQTLLPMIEETMRYSGFSLEELDAIAVAAGPGSFTGLRIGASTVKGLGLVLDKPIVPVPTLEWMAYQLAEVDGFICPMMDARRNQVYTGIYEMRDGNLVEIMKQCAMDVHELMKELGKYPVKVHFLGDGVPVYFDVIQDEVTNEYHIAPAHLSRQRAAAVAALGMEYYHQGKIETAAQHRPVYLRKSQAEREREQRLNAN